MELGFFDYGWIGFGIYFIAFEGYALYLNTKEKTAESKKRRTLSSIIWTLGGTLPGESSNAGTWTRRAILGLALLWLSVHSLSGGQIV